MSILSTLAIEEKTRMRIKAAVLIINLTLVQTTYTQITLQHHDGDQFVHCYLLLFTIRSEVS